MDICWGFSKGCACASNSSGRLVSKHSLCQPGSVLMLFRNLLLTLIASRSVAFAQQANCTVEENGNYYDLSSLTSK